MRSRTVTGVLVTAGALVGLVTGCSTNDAETGPSSALESTAHPPSTTPTRTAAPSATTEPTTRPTAEATPASQPGTVDPQQPTAESAESTGPTVVPTPAAQPCDSASAGTFATLAAESPVGSRLAHPVVFSSLQCAGTSAVAQTAPDGVHQPTGVLFRYSSGDGQWIAVEVGSAMDCGRFGTTPEEAAILEGCR